MPTLGTPELLIIAFVVILLFGTKKLPDAARSLGRALRIFKAETRGLSQDDQAPAAAVPTAAATPQAHPAPASAPAPRPIAAGQPAAPGPPDVPAPVTAVNGHATPAGDPPLR
jgi:sec-independent protein translocase protein TatA